MIGKSIVLKTATIYYFLYMTMSQTHIELLNYYPNSFGHCSVFSMVFDLTLSNIWVTSDDHFPVWCTSQLYWPIGDDIATQLLSNLSGDCKVFSMVFDITLSHQGSQRWSLTHLMHFTVRLSDRRWDIVPTVVQGSSIYIWCKTSRLHSIDSSILLFTVGTLSKCIIYLFTGKHFVL